jgi:transposase
VCHYLRDPIRNSPALEKFFAEALDGVLADATYADAKRLARRLRKHTDDLFTFLDYPEVPYDNDIAEDDRPPVILRKNCQSNRSERCVAVPAVLMSVCRTLRVRGHDPLATNRLRPQNLLTTGQLPPLPAEPVADG